MKKLFSIIILLFMFIYAAVTPIALATAGWTNARNLNKARSWHKAVKISNGKVLVAGGAEACHLVQAELYNSATDTWSNTGAMAQKRSNHTLNVVIASGGAEKVIVAGGNAGSCFGGTVYNSTELYSTASGTWSAGPNMNSARFQHVSVTMDDGTILVIGGQSNTSYTYSLSSTESYDPIGNSWTSEGSMNITRGLGHAAVVLDDGKVLVSGGKTSTNSATATVEIYDPSSNQWTLMRPMNTARFDHTATLLPNGDVLVVGGNGSPASNTAEVYDVSNNSWSNTSNALTYNHSGHTATLITLSDDTQNVLVAGNGSGSSSNWNKVELYDPVGDSWSTTTSMNTGRSRHTATLLDNGTVLVAGGVASGGVSNTSEYYTAPY